MRGRRAPVERERRFGNCRGTLDAKKSSMAQRIAAAIDLVHALLMIAQIALLPLLFVHRWPRATRAYAIYAIVFVGLSQVSQWTLGSCFLTVLAQRLWRAGVSSSAPSEWLTVRLSQAVFHLTPSHADVILLSEIILVVTAVGVLYTAHRGHLRGSRTPSVI